MKIRKRVDKRSKRYKNENERLMYEVDIRFSKKQLEKLEKIRKNTPISTFIRKQSLRGKVIPEQRAKLERDLIADLRRIGVNLNQITKQINIFKENAQIDNYMIEIRSYMEELRERMKKL